jgi:hypothetical protein
VSFLLSSPVTTATADYPELVVEWLPAQGPRAADGAWCDITPYVAAGRVSRGRQYELDRFQAGSLNLTLRADTRLFDPEDVSGPFYPWLVPMRQVRVSAVWDSVRYPIWRGYITDWGAVTPDDALFVSEVSGKDAFALLEAITLPESFYEFHVAASAPLHWWRLAEAEGSAEVVDSGSDPAFGTLQGAGELGASGIVAFGGGASCFTNDGTAGYVQLPNDVFVAATGPYSLSAWFQADTVASSDLPIVSLGAGGSNGYNIAVRRTTGTLVYNFNGSSAILESPSRVDDGLPHHVAVVFDSSSNSTLYLDGVSVDTAVIDQYFSASYCAIGTRQLHANDQATIGGQTFFDGEIAEVAVWDRELSASEVADQYAAGANAFSGEDTGARVDRVLDLVGWPSTLRDIDTGASTVGSFDLGGQSLLEYLQALADTEAGMFLMGTDGVLIFLSRHAPYLDAVSTTSQATYGDLSSHALQYANDGLLPLRDEALIRNPVTAARQGGATATARDATLIEKYGDRTWSAASTLDSNDNVLVDRANWFLALYKELGTRFGDITFRPRGAPDDLWPEVLGRAIGDRVTVERTPLGLGAQVSLEQLVQRVEHAFSPTEWETRLRGTPAPTDSVWILGDSTYGVLGSTTRLAY